jgi:hypothetical protein
MNTSSRDSTVNGRRLLPVRLPSPIFFISRTRESTTVTMLRRRILLHVDKADVPRARSQTLRE